jgi:hypothetical protein
MGKFICPRCGMLLLFAESNRENAESSMQDHLDSHLLKLDHAVMISMIKDLVAIRLNHL